MPNDITNNDKMNFILLLELDVKGARSSMNFESANLLNRFLFIIRIVTYMAINIGIMRS